MRNVDRLVDWVASAKLAVAVAVLAAGVVFIVLARGSVRETANTVGAALLAGSLVYVLLEFTGWLVESRTSDAVQKCGLRGVYPSRSDMEARRGPYVMLVRDARREFRAVGLTLDSFLKSPGLQQELVEWLHRRNHGVVKLLFISSESQFFHQRGVEQGDPARVASKLASTHVRLGDLSRELKRRAFDNRLEVRIYDRMPVHSMFIIDDYRALVMPYLYHSTDGPWLEFVRNEEGMFNHYLDSFEELWKVSIPIAPDQLPVLRVTVDKKAPDDWHNASDSQLIA